VTPGILRLGTRGSALARAQADLVRRALERRHPGLAVTPVIIRTSGDEQTSRPPVPSGLKGLFVKEIEEALLAGTIDFGVHSMKDLPARLAPGLIVAAVPERADARDVLIGGGAGGLADLPPRARVGTASARRRALLLARRGDLEIVELRGNVDTRLRRWREGVVEAIVLAAAGLARLGLAEPAARPIEPDDLLPAVGQGALALECRADDRETRERLAAIEDADAATAVAAERGFLLGIGGDCNTPLAAHATVHGGEVALRALVCDPTGTRRLEAAASGPASAAERLGQTLAERLLARGAAALLGR